MLQKTDSNGDHLHFQLPKKLIALMIHSEIEALKRHSDQNERFNQNDISCQHAYLHPKVVLQWSLE